MENYSRHNKPWTIPEILRLQREWELLKLSVKEISELHKRTPKAIEFKLLNENFATENEICNKNIINKLVDDIVFISILDTKIWTN